VAALVAAFVADKNRLGLPVVMTESDSPAFAEMRDPGAFLKVLEHVVTNAVEATPKGSETVVRIGKGGNEIRVLVEDRGPGMTPQFIANELFRPLKTTKAQGFGIGAFQAREIMRDLGGDIDIRSKVGEGTSVALCLPAIVAVEEVARA